MCLCNCGSVATELFAKCVCVGARAVCLCYCLCDCFCDCVRVIVVMLPQILFQKLMNVRVSDVDCLAEVNDVHTLVLSFVRGACVKEEQIGWGRVAGPCQLLGQGQ